MKIKRVIDRISNKLDTKIYEYSNELEEFIDKSNGEICEYFSELKEKALILEEYYSFLDSITDMESPKEITQLEGIYQIYGNKILLNYNGDDIIEKVLEYHKNEETIEINTDGYTFILEKELKEVFFKILVILM